MMNEFLDYSKLFITKLLPVSFPFFILSTLLIEYGITNLIPFASSSFYVFFLSLISGFPSGAKYTKDLFLKKQINEEEANQCLKFTHFPNPLFVLGTISSTLNDSLLAKKIYLAIFLSNFTLFLLSKKEKKVPLEKSNAKKDFSTALSSAITSSSKTILLIYGTSLFFYLLSIAFTKHLSFSCYLFVFVNGIFDLTKGIFSTTLLQDVTLRAYFILLFVSLGGISIHMQTKSILLDTPLSYRSFFKGRIIGTILSLIFFTLLVFLF